MPRSGPRTHPPVPLGNSPEEVESRCLMDAQASVKQQAFYMHKGIESDNLKEALTCASSLLGELRTGKLQPQRYFELYMQVNM
jgi:vacuolar protein sorting-associated protein 35